MESKRGRVAVIGAGPAGLFAAHLLAKENFHVALFESHSKPGGCASYFRRESSAGKASFDAGATLMNHFSEGQFLNRLLCHIEVSPPAFEKSKSVYFRQSSRPPFSLDLASPESFIQSLAQAFPEDAVQIKSFFPKIFRSAARINSAMQKVPHLPIECLQDLKLNLPLLPHVLPEFRKLFAGMSHSFKDDLKAQHFSEDFHRWVNMNTLITLQTDSSQAAPAWGAMALYFYLMDPGTFRGGMRAFFELLLGELKKKAEVYMRSAVLRVHQEGNKYFLENFLGVRSGPFDYVISSIPRFNTQELFSSRLTNSRSNWQHLKPIMWGAVTAYVVIKDQLSFPAAAFNLHSQKEGEDAYLSFSARDDLERSPQGHRTITICAHSGLDQWKEPTNYSEMKKAIGAKLLSHLHEACPGVEVIFQEFGTPRSFLRYTRRIEGSVGGVPLSRDYTLQHSLSQRTHLKNVYQIGDTSFPGQSIYGCAVGSCAAVEKILDRKLRF